MKREKKNKNNNKNATQRRLGNGSSNGYTRNTNVLVGALGRNLAFGFPDRMVCKLRYVDTYALTVTAGSLAKQFIYLNSTFDPDNTGTGHQPMYRDTYAAIYDQYAVVSASVKVKFINPSTTTIVVGCVIEDDNASSSTVNTLCEQNHGRHTILPGITGSLSTHTFNVPWDCVSVLGIDPFTSETYKTAVGSNPTEVSSLAIWGTNFDASSISITVHVELEQTVLWTELTTPTSS